MCNRQSSSPADPALETARDARAAVRAGSRPLVRILVVLGALALALPVQARDPASLGDLQIPVDRVPDWHPLDHLPLDTSSWTVTNVPCGDESTIRSALSNAQPNTVLQLAANCTYRFPTNQTLRLGRSRVVLRGAGNFSTVLQFEQVDAMGMILGSGGAPFGDARSWTSGYGIHERVLGVSSTAGLQPGDWVRLRADSEPDWHQNARNGYAAKLVCVGPNGTDACGSLAGNQVKLDRGLNSRFTQGGQLLERVTGSVVEHAGLENLRIQHSNPSRIESYRDRIRIQGCHECWIVGNSFGDAGNNHITVRDASRNLIRSNDFGSNQCTDEGQTCLWNKGAIYFNDHAYDNVYENNVVVDSPSGPLLQNGGGNIVAYNYLTSNNSVECERHIFLHGQGVRASLIEGNDVTCMMEWDSYRDGQGYFNTFYRNRLRQTPETGTSYPGYYRGRLGGEAQGSFIHRYIQVIGNHVNQLQGGPFPTGLPLDHSTDDTHYHYRTWVSYNVARDDVILDSRARETTAIENHIRTSPPSAWSTLNFPRSLYRSGAPSWWCAESGEFPNIGAMSDTAGQYSRLPAQIRAEGRTCTTGGQSARLPAPVMLED